MSIPSSTSRTNRTLSPSDQRRAAKRRQALSDRLRTFEAALPGIRPGKRARASTSQSTSSRSHSTGAARTSTRSVSTRSSRGTHSRTAFAGIVVTASQLGFSSFHWSKLFSFAALAAVLFGLYWVQSDSAWYVYPQQTTIAGYRLVDPNALYAASGIDGWNVFWLRRDEIRSRILENPWISDVRVNLSAPGNVALQVEEAPVVAVWMTDAGNYWVSPTGAALRFEGDVPPTMPRLIDPMQEAAVAGTPQGTEVDTQIVGSALALIGQMSGLLEVRYSQAYGLNFALPGTSLWVYWGDGTETKEKLEAIAVGKQYVASGELDTTILDVRIPERPFVK